MIRTGVLAAAVTLIAVIYEWRRRRGSGGHVYVAPDSARCPERLGLDAAPTGVGDPLAGVLRSIDELIGEGQ